MLVLGIDTATRIGSVGLIVVAGDSEAGAGSGGIGEKPLAEVTRDSGLRHGAELLPMVDECVARAAVELEAVEAVAVSIGPGSFTGLRVGLATAKGLVLAGGGAIVGVPTLEALAAPLLDPTLAPPDATPPPAPRLLCTCLDARKGEVYAALFAPGAGSGAVPAFRRLAPDRAVSPAGLVATIQAWERGRGEVGAAGGGEVVLVGDGAERYSREIEQGLGARARILPFARYHPRGIAIATLGARELARRGADDLAALVPRYARASEAERARAAAGGEGAERASR